MTETIAADATPAAQGQLGIGTPPLPKLPSRLDLAESRVAALSLRTGLELELVHRERRRNEWVVRYVDGDTVAENDDPLYAAWAAESLL